MVMPTWCTHKNTPDFHYLLNVSFRLEQDNRFAESLTILAFLFAEEESAILYCSQRAHRVSSHINLSQDQ